MENIKLFSFDTNLEITSNLDNYMDRYHYAPWISDWMLEQMAEGNYQITEENYRTYLEQKAEIYRSYDYDKVWEMYEMLEDAS